MALSATLTADFSSFVDAAKDGSAALKEFKATAATTGEVLETMTAGYDTGAAVAETKSLTAALGQVSATAATTAPAIDEVGVASADAALSTTSFKGAFDQVDKSLAAAGIQLGPIPGMLDELSAAAGKSVTQLGLFGTAGAAVAAGMAGWSVGRQIADWFDLDEKIGNATAKLMGWGDVAAETAAAKTDTLARASAVAGREISTMAEAIRVLGDEATKTAEDLKLEEAATEKVAGAVAKLFGYDDINRAELYRDALGGVENVSKLTTAAKKELKAAVTAAIDSYVALGQTAPPELLAIQRATTELITVTKSFSAANSGAWTQYAATVEEGSVRIARFIEAAKLGWEDIGGTSKAMLEEVARDTAEKYAVALAHSENFTGKQIADFRRAAEAARVAVDAWGTDTLEAYDEIALASARTADQQIADASRAAAATTTSWHEAMTAVQQGQGTMGGTVGGVIDTGPTARASIQKAYDEGRY